MNILFNSQGIAKYREELKSLHSKLEHINREFNSIKSRKDEFEFEIYSNTLDRLSVQLELLQKNLADNYQFIKLVEEEYDRLLKIDYNAIPSDEIKNNSRSNINAATSLKLLEFFKESKCKKSYLPVTVFENIAVVKTSNLFKNGGGIVQDWLLKKLNNTTTYPLDNQTYTMANRSPSRYTEIINEVFNKQMITDNTRFTFKVMDSMNAKLDFIQDDKIQHLLDSIGKDYGWFSMEPDEIRNFADAGIPSIAVFCSKHYNEVIYTVPPVKDKPIGEIFIQDVSENLSQLKNINSIKYEDGSSIKYYVHR